MKNIILFGAGEFGKKIYDYYKDNSYANIIAFCDNDEKKHNTYIDNIKIVSPNELSNIKHNKIIITSLYDTEIYNQLLDMGIDKNTIYIENINTISSPLGNNSKLEMAHELLLYTCDLFNKADIKYHLDHGTLLGITRDNTLLAWDKDIDFAMPSSELENIVNILKTSLVSFKSIYCKNNNWTYIVRNDKAVKIDNDFILKPITIKIFNNCNEELTNGFDLDIKFKYEYNNKVYWTVGIRTLFSDVNLCFPTTSVIFKETKLQVPFDTNKYLTLLYGNWKTPVKEWTYSQYQNIDTE